MPIPRWCTENRFSSGLQEQTRQGKSGEGRPKGETEVELVWGLKIPMRDGVQLNCTVYKPERMKKGLPIIFTLTPYTADTYHERAFYFARNGYVFCLVDVRGRGNSGGRFEPFVNEALDGYDTVEWLARQSWSNGKVAMWGGSYAGYDQWATLKELPPHLETIVPAAAACPGVDFPFIAGVRFSYEAQWLTLTSGVTANSKIFEEAKFWIGRFQELYLKHLPFGELDKVVGNPSEHFQTGLQHEIGDTYWTRMVPSPEQYRRMDVPILTITGHYDGDQPGALHFYKMHMRFGSPNARDRHYLIVGPWDHAGTRTPSKEFGGLKLGEASLVDLNKLHKEWYDWTLKNGKKPVFLKKRVSYYVTGAEEWKCADSFEETSRARWRLYLNSSHGNATDAFHSGMLTEIRPRESPPDKYTYDPLDTRRSWIEQEEFKEFITDQRYPLNLFGNGVVYHTDPIPEGIEVTGHARFAVWISLDAPDTDFDVSLYEVMPNGNSVWLTSDIMRARYRESVKNPKLVKPGDVNMFKFDRFTFVSRRLAKQSRVRLVLQCPNSIYWQKNYNSGGNVSKESAKDARTAHVAVYHDSSHPSLLELPIGEKQPAKAEPGKS